MQTEPTKITSSDLLKFTLSNKYCVLKAGLEMSSIFNSALYGQLKQFYKIELSTATINTQKLDYSDSFIKSLVGDQMEQIGLEKGEQMLPGYYLFKNSKLVGYHPGTFDISKLDPGIVKASLWLSLAFGVISGISQKSFASGLLTFSQTMEVPTGMNIFNFFKEIIESKSEIDIRRRQKIIFHTELDKAYATLKVTKFSTDEEVKSSWKNLLKQYHPDKSTEDKDSRHRITVSINEAYELIVNHRKTTKNKFNFSTV